ncbi:hypothetical protein JC1_54 [Burkholderia phage JC1]|nr:hypothetical protein JC1_54 [Burkholderia phage JC1]
MDFYALNETPINGWATRQGFGQAAMSLAGTGASANVVLGTGAAALRLQTLGKGTRRAMASAGVTMVLQTAGDGTRRVPADASAVIELGAGAEGKVAAGVGGHATMMLTWPYGQGGIIAHAAGTATLELNAAAEGRAAAGRHGFATSYMLLFAGAHGRSVTPLKGSAIAEMWLYPRAEPYLVTQNGGVIEMALRTASRERIGNRVHGDGVVVMALEMLRDEARQYRLVAGSGSLSIALAVEARDARIAVLPSAIYPAPRARGMRVDRENRTLRVPRPQRAYEITEASCSAFS